MGTSRTVVDEGGEEGDTDKDTSRGEEGDTDKDTAGTSRTEVNVVFQESVVSESVWVLLWSSKLLLLEHVFYRR